MSERHRFSDEEVSFIGELFQMGIKNSERTRLFNERFGTQLCVESIVHKAKSSKLRLHNWYEGEKDEFIKENIHKYDEEEFTRLFNEKFHSNKSYSALKQRGMRQGVKFERFLYTDEHINFLRDNVRGENWNSLTKKFNEHFGTDKSRYVIATVCSRNGILFQTTGEEKYRNSSKTSIMEVGSEIVYKGVVWVKVKESEYRGVSARECHRRMSDTFMKKHRYLYEKYHNEKLEDSDYVIFADGDKRNFSKENLIKVSQGACSKILQNDVIGKPKEYIETYAMIYELDKKIKEEPNGNEDTP